MQLSARQEKILDFIACFIKRHGYAPTYEEIRQGLAISNKSLVHYHLKVLEQAGKICRNPGSPRSIRLNNESTS